MPQQMGSFFLVQLNLLFLNSWMLNFGSCCCLWEATIGKKKENSISLLRHVRIKCPCYLVCNWFSPLAYFVFDFKALNVFIHLFQNIAGEKRVLNSELWHACAGPLVSLPAIGSRVVYFPQGHSEQVSRGEFGCTILYKLILDWVIYSVRQLVLSEEEWST